MPLGCASEPAGEQVPLGYDRGVIWEPFLLAVILGLVVSAGLYFAYLWPSVEPLEGDDLVAEPVAMKSSEPTESEPT